VGEVLLPDGRSWPQELVKAGLAGGSGHTPCMTRPSRSAKRRPEPPRVGSEPMPTRSRPGHGARGDGRLPMPLPPPPTSPRPSGRSSATRAATSIMNPCARRTRRSLPRTVSLSRALRRRSTPGIAGRGIAREGPPIGGMRPRRDPRAHHSGDADKAGVRWPEDGTAR
jgi:hypothetical protein